VIYISIVDPNLYDLRGGPVPLPVPDESRVRATRCKNFLRRVDEDPEFSSRVIFSDESLFTQEGIFNHHNMHMWSEKNPRVTRLTNFQTRWKLNVWAGIMGTNIH